MIEVTMKQPGKIAMLHICMAIFLGCFFFGVFAANLWMKDENLWLGFAIERQMQSFRQGVEITSDKLYRLIAVRVLPWMILLVTGMFRPGRLVEKIWFGWMGLSGGFVFVTFLSRYGWKGMVYMVLCGFPHIPVYLIAFLLLIILLEAGAGIRWSRKNQMQISSGTQKTIFLLVLFLMLDSGIYILGIWLECSANFWILLHLTACR